VKPDDITTGPLSSISDLIDLEESLLMPARTIFPDVEGLGRFLHWHLETLVTTIL